MPKIVFQIFLAFLFVNSLQTQSNFSNLEPFYLNYTTDDGLPSSECHHTIQDQKGYIWIATDNGVSRFDGYGFRNFSAEDGLKNNVIFYLQEDKQGRIWMLTMSGNLYYYDYQKDRILAFEYNSEIQQYQGKFDWAGPFYVDSLNTIYIGLANFGIVKIKEDGDTFLLQSKNMAATILMEIEDKLIFSIVYCKSKKCFETYTNVVRPWEFYRDTSLVYRTIFSIDQFNFDFDYIHAKLRGNSTIVKRFFDGRILGQNFYTFYQFDAKFNPKFIQHSFRAANEKSILELDDGRIIVGVTSPGGLFEFKNSDDLLENKPASNIFNDLRISSIQKDKNGGLWVTTIKKGLYFIPHFEEKIINRKIGIASDNISGFLVEDKGEILLGEGNQAIYKLDLNQNKLEQLSEYKSSGPIRKLYRNPEKDELWVGSGNLSWLKNGKWNYRLKDKNGLPFGAIGLAKSFNLSNDKKHIWSWRSISFFKINLETKCIELDANDYKIRGSFQAVFEDFEDRIWVGNLQGLFEFRDSTLIPQIRHAAFQVRVEDIRQMADSTLIIGTKGAGVVFWKAEETIQVTVEDGLTSNMVERIYIDSLQRVWVGTSEGLNLIRLDDERKPFVRNYTQKHGLPSNEINQVQVFENEIWVATAKGLIKLPEWKLDTITTQPFLEKILVNGVRLNNFEEGETILKYNENSIQIEFLTIDFAQNGNIQYRYKLSPSQKDWVYTKNRRLDFSALNDNPYLLEIQSQNRDGFWSKSAVFEFTISTPYWKTWWFFVGLFLLTGAIFFIWFDTRIKRLKRETTLIRQMAEAEQFALRSQMNPHFIFNCLASIQGLISTGQKDKAIRYLARFSKLIRTALNFMGKDRITLEEEIEMIKNYLELEKMRHGEKFEYHLEIDPDLDVFDTEILPLMVQPFVENAIVHAFPDKKKGGILKIKYLEEKGNLMVIVEDNGIGITAAQNRKSPKEKAYESVGIGIIKRRLALKNEKGDKNLKMIEMQDENGKVLGTKVIIDFEWQE